MAKNKNNHCEHKECFEFCKNKLMEETDFKYVTVASIEKQTEDEYLLRFNETINHDPGQFFQMSIPGIGESAISICSHNTKYFEVSVRSVGNVTAHICALKKGDQIAIRGPYGRGYNMPQFHNNNVVIVAGGSGVAPVRGIIQYVEQNRDKFRNVDVLLGFRAIHNIIFEKDFKGWRNKNISVDIILSEKSNFKRIKHGLITDLLENDCVKSNQNKIVFVCGPPMMINAACKVLLEKGFNKDQIYISEERQMKCAVGRCGHCMIQDKYCCTDGPVFRYDELEGYQG
ncbi:MAG: FAD/NAD(P)-binding protein [Nanoarchaeota archaeon]|nr:FAD/NAD(P)-binding protein [Nanoarchaeota archaeon]